MNNEIVYSKNTIGIIYFHQGWTDIINCLALIDYYIENKKYDNFYLIIYYNDRTKIIDFYLKNKKNVKLHSYVLLDNININESIYEILFHGNYDSCRNDKYKNVFGNSSNFELGNGGFVKCFYELYDIPLKVKIDYFNLKRDEDIEEKIYNNFIEKYGKKYILNHEIDFSSENKDISCVNLNEISEIFFDYIKVLENSIEFHLLDSSWGALIYILDCKYGLFKDKKIYLYAKRGYTKMFTEPILLPNWEIII